MPGHGAAPPGTIQGEFMKRASRFVLGVSIVLLLSQLAVTQVSHAFVWSSKTGMQDLGTLPGDTDSRAYGINASGQIVGHSYVGGTTDYHAFLWTSTGGMQSLGTLGGCCSSARAINSSGEVAGWSETPGDTGKHAFLWTPVSGMQDLGTLGGDSFGTAINEIGAVAGLSYGNSGISAFLWTPTSGMRALPNQFSSILALGLGLNAHRVIGAAFIHPFDTLRAVVWKVGEGMRSLGTLGGNNSEALGINASNEVVGDSFVSKGIDHAFLWTPGAGMQDLGTLGGKKSFAIAINSSGQIAGYSYTSAGASEQHAVLWTGQVPQDLGTLGGTNSFALGINDTGQVVGLADLP